MNNTTSTTNTKNPHDDISDIVLEKEKTPGALAIQTAAPRSIFTMSESHFERLRFLATVLTRTGFTYSQIDRRPARASELFVLMLKGMELGLEPMTALDLIDAIQGRPTLKPQGMLALINHSDELDDMKIEATDVGCTVTMTRKGRSPHVERFAFEDAQKLGLIDKTGSSYKTQPRVMYKWRAIAACARVVFPDIIKGMYMNIELEPAIEITDDGDVVEGQYTPTASTSNTPSTSSSSTSGASAADDLPKTPAAKVSWLDAKDKEGQTGRDKLLVWLRQKYDMTSEEGLKLVGIEPGKDWDSRFTDGKAACAAVVGAIQNAPPAQPKNSGDEDKKAGWTSQDLIDMSNWLWASFGRGQDDFLPALGKHSFQEYPSREEAVKACRALVLKERWPVVSEQAEYNGKFISFHTAVGGIRHYSRTRFVELIGPEYAESNGVANWESGKTYEIEALEITWEKAGSDKSPYLKLVEVKPLFANSDAAEIDAETQELLDFFSTEAATV